MNKIYLFVLLFALLASCVPNRKVIYLQNDISDQDIVTDSILKTYQMKEFEYELQPQDILSIKVSSLTPTEYNFFSETERELGQGDPLLSGYLIDDDGFIEIPAVGRVELQGLTIKEAEIKIKSALENFLQTPVVRLKLLNFNVTILGEVSSPGTINSYNSKFTIMDAIATAGDLTELADRSNIKLIRYEEDEAQLIYINTLDDDLLTSSYFYLKPNDLIIVAPLDVKNIRQYQVPTIGLVLSTLSAITLLVLRLSR